MVRYYTDDFEFKEPIFRRLTKNEYDGLMSEIQSYEEIIGVFFRNEINIAIYIDSQKEFDDFIKHVSSGHFISCEFYAKNKPLQIKPPLSPNLSGFSIPPPLNLSFCTLSIPQLVSLPGHLNKVELAMAEKRDIALSLRHEIRVEHGIEPGSTPVCVNNESKNKSRSNSSEDGNGIRKTVSFHRNLSQERIFDKDHPSIHFIEPNQLTEQGSTIELTLENSPATKEGEISDAIEHLHISFSNENDYIDSKIINKDFFNL
jgi:hypothetical protein